MFKLTPEQITARLGRNARSSLEDNDVNININADVDGEGDNDGLLDPETMDTSETPEAAELDVQDQAAEVEAAVADADEVNETVEGLESLYIALATISEENHPMDAAAAILLQNQVKTLTGKFGLSPSEIGVASTEDFGLFPDSSTTDSMEGIKETIKAGIDRLIAFLKNIWTAITNFVKGLFDSTFAARTKHKALSAKLKDKGVTGKKVKAAAVIALQVKNAATEARTLADFATKVQSARLDTVVSTVSNSDVNSEDIGKALSGVLDSLGSYAGKQMIGGCAYSESDSGTPQFKRKEDMKGLEVTLTADQVQGALNGADTLLKVCEKYKQTQNQRKSLNDAMTKSVKATASAAEDKAIAAMTARSKAVSYWNAFVSFETKVMSTCLTVTNSLNNVAAASIGEAKSKD